MDVTKGRLTDHMKFEAGFTDAHGNFNFHNLLNWTCKVRIKKLNPNAIIPKYAKHGDAGLDLTVTEFNWDEANAVWRYRSGLAFEIPEGFVGLVFPRSSICQTKVNLTNCVGVIDSGYRGEVTAVFRDVDYHTSRAPYKVGERFAQLIIVPYPKVIFEEVDELSETDRGAGGYGSTGK